MRPRSVFVGALLAVVALAAPGTATGSTVTTSHPPSVAAVSCLADYATQRWPNGYMVWMSVTNTGSDPVDNWWVEFDLPSGAQIDEGWNGTFTLKNNRVRVDAPSWHKFLLPDDSAIPQFYGTYPNPNVFILSNITLNGVACAIPV